MVLERALLTNVHRLRSKSHTDERSTCMIGEETSLRLTPKKLYGLACSRHHEPELLA